MGKENKKQMNKSANIAKTSSKSKRVSLPKGVDSALDYLVGKKISCKLLQFPYVDMKNCQTPVKEYLRVKNGDLGASTSKQPSFRLQKAKDISRRESLGRRRNDFLNSSSSSEDNSKEADARNGGRRCVRSPTPFECIKVSSSSDEKESVPPVIRKKVLMKKAKKSPQKKKAEVVVISDDDSEPPKANGGKSTDTEEDEEQMDIGKKPSTPKDKSKNAAKELTPVPSSSDDGSSVFDITTSKKRPWEDSNNSTPAKIPRLLASPRRSPRSSCQVIEPSTSDKPKTPTKIEKPKAKSPTKMEKSKIKPQSKNAKLPAKKTEKKKRLVSVNEQTKEVRSQNDFLDRLDLKKKSKEDEMSEKKSKVDEENETGKENKTPTEKKKKKKSKSKKPAITFKLRFAKSFKYSSFSCDSCSEVFKKNVHLQLHLLQHIDKRKCFVKVFRHDLPQKYCFTGEDENRFLKPSEDAKFKNLSEPTSTTTDVESFSGFAMSASVNTSTPHYENEEGNNALNQVDKNSLEEMSDDEDITNAVTQVDKIGDNDETLKMDLGNALADGSSLEEKSDDEDIRNGMTQVDKYVDNEETLKMNLDRALLEGSGQDSEKSDEEPEKVDKSIKVMEDVMICESRNADRHSESEEENVNESDESEIISSVKRRRKLLKIDSDDEVIPNQKARIEVSENEDEQNSSGVTEYCTALDCSPYEDAIPSTQPAQQDLQDTIPSSQEDQQDLEDTIPATQPEEETLENCNEKSALSKAVPKKSKNKKVSFLLSDTDSDNEESTTVHQQKADCEENNSEDECISTKKAKKSSVAKNSEGINDSDNEDDDGSSKSEDTSHDSNVAECNTMRPDLNTEEIDSAIENLNSQEEFSESENEGNLDKNVPKEPSSEEDVEKCDENSDNSDFEVFDSCTPWNKDAATKKNSNSQKEKSSKKNLENEVETNGKHTKDQSSDEGSEVVDFELEEKMSNSNMDQFERTEVDNDESEELLEKINHIDTQLKKFISEDTSSEHKKDDLLTNEDLINILESSSHDFK